MPVAAKVSVAGFSSAGAVPRQADFLRHSQRSKPADRILWLVASSLSCRFLYIVTSFLQRPVETSVLAWGTVKVFDPYHHPSLSETTSFIVRQIPVKGRWLGA